VVDPRPESGVDRDDRALVRACLAGNQDAGTALVETYVRMVGTVIWRATGRRDVIEDLTQETFLRVFKALEYFDARSRLSTWIYTIAHNVAIDHLRKSSGAAFEPLTWRDDEDGVGDERQVASPEPDPEALLTREESERLVRDGLAALPLKYRVPVMYAAIDGLDYPTIASMLNVPLGTVKTLIFRGKRMLKDDIARRLGAPHET
jgi:RNA polymerase sigma-70 factor (ECF subfamily)